MNVVERYLAKASFSGQTKIRMMRQLQRLIEAGVPLSRSLDMLRNLYSRQGRKPREPLALMIIEWQSRLGQGKSLSASMSGWISLPEEMIIEAGEQSEKLAGSLSDALQANGASARIRNTILGGLAYPFIMLVALCFMLWGFSTEIVPTFETIVPAEEWTGNAAVMYSVSQFVRNWMLLVGVVVVALVVAVILTFPVLLGRVRSTLDRVPPWSIYKITQGASFMISLRGFLAAGMPIPEALRKLMRSGNPYMRERIAAILARINLGKNLGDAMREAGHNFPDNDIAGEVSIYAGLDNFSDSIDMLAKEWTEGSIERARTASKIMNNVMLVLIAGCIGYIAFSLFELQNLITDAANTR